MGHRKAMTFSPKWTLHYSPPSPGFWLSWFSCTWFCAYKTVSPVAFKIYFFNNLQNHFLSWVDLCCVSFYSYPQWLPSSNCYHFYTENFVTRAQQNLLQLNNFKKVKLFDLKYTEHLNWLKKLRNRLILPFATFKSPCAVNMTIGLDLQVRVLKINGL